MRQKERCAVVQFCFAFPREVAFFEEVVKVMLRTCCVFYFVLHMRMYLCSEMGIELLKTYFMHASHLLVACIAAAYHQAWEKYSGRQHFHNQVLGEDICRGGA